MKIMENEIFKPRVYDVPSSSDSKKVYQVTNFRPNRFSCTCPGFRYNCHDHQGYRNRKECRHIKELKAKLLEG